MRRTPLLLQCMEVILSSALVRLWKQSLSLVMQPLEPPCLSWMPLYTTVSDTYTLGSSLIIDMIVVCSLILLVREMVYVLSSPDPAAAPIDGDKACVVVWLAVVVLPMIAVSCATVNTDVSGPR